MAKGCGPRLIRCISSTSPRCETFPFRAQRHAIGRIAFNDDASTPVLTPFSGRVTRLIAKVGDVVKRGDPLFEIDSPEVVQPQNDFIAAFAALNKARAQLNLAQIVERTADEICMKARHAR